MINLNQMRLPKPPKKLLFWVFPILLLSLLFIFVHRRLSGNNKTPLYYYLPDSSREVPNLIQGEVVKRENRILTLRRGNKQVLVEIDSNAKFSLVYPGELPRRMAGFTEDDYLEEISVGSNLNVGGLRPRSQGGWIGTTVTIEQKKQRENK